MRTFLIAALAALACAGAASAQTATTNNLPTACRGPSMDAINWEACLAATPANAPWRPLVLINLGSQAFLQGDYATAVARYDEARPPGQSIISDIAFHTFRGAAYWHVGRREEAAADGDIAWRMLHRDPTLNVPPEVMGGAEEREMVYVFLLPVWQAGDPARFQTALTEFTALPAGDWVSYANRSAVLTQIGQLDNGLAMSNRALALAPDEPNVLNNHCFILHKLDRNAEALPFCERAIIAAPNVAAVNDSMSDVLAALGRCTDAERYITAARRLDPTYAAYREPIVCTPR